MDWSFCQSVLNASIHRAPLHAKRGHDTTVAFHRRKQDGDGSIRSIQPFSIASFLHNVRMVELLLSLGANVYAA